MGKKSHAPLFILFVYFTHLVPPTGLFWTNVFAIQANLVLFKNGPLFVYFHMTGIAQIL